MFRRRHPLPPSRWLHGLVWPRTGWRRAFIYYVRRLARLSGSPHNVAAGFACGVAISFTPLVGLHILLGCLMALIVRGNFLAVAVGTLVGNPWTFPFMWLGGYELGKLLLGSDLAGAQPMPWRIQDLVGYLGRAAQEASAGGTLAMLQHLAADLVAIAKPVLVGGLPLGVAFGLLTYFPLARAIAAYQEARRRRREQRRRGVVRLKGVAAPNDAGTA
jgi:uncharacterized protein